MKITIKDIAKIAGVSPATVSKVINNYSDIGEETKRKITVVMEQTGYKPNGSGKGFKKQNSIGVVLSGKINVDFNHPFFREVLDAFRVEMGHFGYDLLIFSKHGEDNDFLARCMAAQVDGCIIISGVDIEQSIYDLDRSDLPCIGVDIQLSGNKSGFLMTDNHKLSKSVVEHLYLLGHREIAYIGGQPSSLVGQERTQGFTQAMTEFGLTINNEWFMHGDFKIESGYAIMKRFLQQGPPPKAVFAVSDLMAFGAISAIKEHGLRVPNDVAVIGCDDIDSSQYIDPPLTTIRQDKVKIGKLAANMLLDMIKGISDSSSVMVDSELIIRESCGTNTHSSSKHSLKSNIS